MRRIEFKVNYNGFDEPIDAGVISFNDDATEDEIIEYVEEMVSRYITVEVEDIVLN